MVLSKNVIRTLDPLRVEVAEVDPANANAEVISAPRVQHLIRTLKWLTRDGP